MKQENGRVKGNTGLENSLHRHALREAATAVRAAE